MHDNTMVHRQSLRGRLIDRADIHAAWNTRNATWSMVVAGIDTDPRNAREIAGWTRFIPIRTAAVTCIS